MGCLRKKNACDSVSIPLKIITEVAENEREKFSAIPLVLEVL